MCLALIITEDKELADWTHHESDRNFLFITKKRSLKAGGKLQNSQWKNKKKLRHLKTNFYNMFLCMTKAGIGCSYLTSNERSFQISWLQIWGHHWCDGTTQHKKTWKNIYKSLVLTQSKILKNRRQEMGWSLTIFECPHLSSSFSEQTIIFSPEVLSNVSSLVVHSIIGNMTIISNECPPPRLCKGLGGTCLYIMIFTLLGVTLNNEIYGEDCCTSFWLTPALTRPWWLVMSYVPHCVGSHNTVSSR